MEDLRPHIVFILADQLRADFLGCYGAGFAKTPNIDRIAAEGTRYNKAYSTCPLCVPARAMLLTGAGPRKTGIITNGQWLRPDYRKTGMKTWPEMLSESGYSTAAIGKMHFYPWDERHGFGHRVVAEDKRWINVRDDYWHYLQHRGMRKYHGNEHENYFEHQGAIVNKIPWEDSVDRFVGSATCDFIDNYNDPQPFAVMVGFPGPHCPYDPSPEFLRDVTAGDMPEPIDTPDLLPLLTKRELQGQRRPWNGVDYSQFTRESKIRIRTHYTALINQIDVEVGRILTSLEQKGLLENTLIVFSSDHGDYLGDHGLIGKNSFFESAIRVPMLLRMPGNTPSVRDDLVELGDVTATLLNAAEIEVPTYMDSRPLPAISSAGAEFPREELVGMLGTGWMLYDGRYKLCRYTTGEKVLFDLVEDPDEMHDLSGAEDHAERVAGMDARLVNLIMTGFLESHQDKIAHASWEDPDFGRKGWRRQYPQSVPDR